MFLKFLSDHDYEDEFSYFVFRMETLIAGFVVEASKYIDHLSDEQAQNYFEHCFAQCFDQNNEALKNFWTPPIPSIEWFWNYFDQELPFMIQEAKRISQSNQVPETPDFDKKKIREFARRNPLFFAQLAPDDLPPNEAKHFHEHSADNSEHLHQH